MENDISQHYSHDVSNARFVVSYTLAYRCRVFTRNAFYYDTESSYVARQLVVTDGKEPTPTTLRTQHVPPNSYTLPISVGPSLSRNGSTISESSYITSGMVTTYGSEAPIPTTMRTQRPLPVSVGPSLSSKRSVNSMPQQEHLLCWG